MDADQPSYGRFQTYPSSLAMHPAGYAIGIDSRTCKLSILELPAEGLPDVAAPQAIHFAGAAMSEQRPGLLFRPVGVTCSYDGTILVLDETKAGSDDFATIPAVARIQALAVSGNSVARFKEGEGNPTDRKSTRLNSSQ